jgi:putative endonuclease
MSEKRKKAYRRGIFAEVICIFWLRLKGYRIIAKRMRNNQGEIDIIARQKSMMCFIEVKVRKTREDALESITARQRQRIANAANLFLAQHAKYAGLDDRFDIMLVVPFRLPQHIPHAWTLL